VPVITEMIKVKFRVLQLPCQYILIAVLNYVIVFSAI
jgi:hypothetical protein